MNSTIFTSKQNKSIKENKAKGKTAVKGLQSASALPPSDGRPHNGYTVSATGGAALYSIAIDRIQPNPSQPRRSFEDSSILRLAESIRRYGVISPITVRSGVPAADGQPRYELVAGERRLRAAMLLGMREMPCIVITADSRRSAEISLSENLQRSPLNIFEEAQALSSLCDIYSLSPEEAADLLCCPYTFIQNRLQLLRLSEDERSLILANGLSDRHALAVLRLPSLELRCRALSFIAANQLNIADTETYIEALLSGKGTTKPAPRRVYIIRDVGVFYNTLDRAASLMREAGYGITCQRRELDNRTEIFITVPRREQEIKQADASC